MSIAKEYLKCYMKPLIDYYTKGFENVFEDPEALKKKVDHFKQFIDFLGICNE